MQSRRDDDVSDRLNSWKRVQSCLNLCGRRIRLERSSRFVSKRNHKLPLAGCHAGEATQSQRLQFLHKSPGLQGLLVADVSKQDVKRAQDRIRNRHPARGHDCRKRIQGGRYLCGSGIHGELRCGGRSERQCKFARRECGNGPEVKPLFFLHVEVPENRIFVGSRQERDVKYPRQGSRLLHRNPASRGNRRQGI